MTKGKNRKVVSLKNKATRKEMVRYIGQLEDYIRELKKYIDEQCSPKGEVLRMYATMRMSIIDVYGEDGFKQVLATIQDANKECGNPSLADAYPYKSEAELMFGKDFENPKDGHKLPEANEDE